MSDRVYQLARFVCAPVVLFAVAACHAPRVAKIDIQPPPAFLLGDFKDDYGDAHTVRASDWYQRPSNRFHIMRWNVREKYLIARNDSANRSAAGKWTRIDWIELEGMAPYGWAFCFTAYDAGTEAVAETGYTPDRSNPRTGCNGYPFTRMKRP